MYTEKYLKLVQTAKLITILEPIESNTYACANALISLEDDFIEIA